MMPIKKILLHIVSVMLFSVLVQTTAMAQRQIKEYSIKDGKMYITLGAKINEASLDSFINQFNLYDLDLKHFVKSGGSMDSLIKLNWKLEIKNNQVLVISKKLLGADNITNPADKISITEDQLALRFPVTSNNIHYGFNRFKNKAAFAVHDSLVTFFTPSYKNAKQVVLSGSFNNWQTDALFMTRVDSGWIATLKLIPGKYWYKFIEDGNWHTDPENLLVENDGLGNNNSVYYKPNFIFKSTAFPNAKKIFVAGSFNEWRPNELQLIKTNIGWLLPLYLADGTYTYRYIVDGNWQADPENNKKILNEFNDYNSLIEMGSQYKIKLDGYINADKVMLVGSFNNWRENELPMNKTATGWELNYSLGKGNYEYTFKIDNKWLDKSSTASNSKFINKPDGALHFNLIIGANYTFHLKGFANAKNIFLAGDFNSWSPNGFAMKKIGDEWVFDVYLTKGKHLYKFVVDNKWILDPGNKLWEQNEERTGNSIFWMEK